MYKGWVATGLVLIIAYVGLQALVTRYVPSAPLPPTFSVTGDATYSTKPQDATIHLTVSAKGKEAADAINANKKVTDTVTNALKAMGITSQDISVNGLQVYGNYDDKGVLSTQQADTKVQVKTKKTDQVSDFINAAFTAGVTTMDGVDYTPAENNQEELDARAKAYDKAQKKAEQLAKITHKRLGKLTGVSEYVSPTTSSSSQSSPAPVAAESTISVSLTYELN